jgi:signal transduction histidine kinase
VERAKALFLAVLGHDLRTPLSAVLAAANTLLLAEGEDNRTVKTAALILRSSARMSQMVSDLIDFTRTRLGDGLPLDRRPLDLGVASQEAIEEIQAVYPEHTVRLARSGDLRGSWDEGRMKQALTNLIENAAQHVTSRTPITVSVSGDGEQVVLTVHNHGPPIPEPDRARIFEPLVRVAETSSPVITPHMGLGLYVVRQIVQAHGGTIDLESTESAGTAFTLRLPRQPQGAPLGRSLPAPEALDIRHAALRSECLATIKAPRTRLLRAPCKRTPLRRARPHHCAESRLVPLGYERW